MNFIIRNLGWMLLGVFFVFMLLLISNNNTVKQGPVIGSGTNLTSTGEQNLETLAEKLDDERLISEEIKIKSDDKLSLFERIFGKKDANQAVEEEKSGTGKITQTSDVKTLDREGVKDIITIKADTQKNESQNLIKDKLVAAKNDTNKVSELPNYITDKVSNSPQIIAGSGNIYQVAVTSLKLNNKNFSQTLAYLQKNDRVQQTQDANVNGCFEVRVIQSQNKKNIAKIGYVCKKYLENVSDQNGENDVSNLIKEENISQGNNNLLKFPQTNIGDIIIIEKSAQLVLKEYTDLAKGDQIDQMTEIDTLGCFIAHVYSSSLASSRDMVGKICLNDIYQ